MSLTNPSKLCSLLISKKRSNPSNCKPIGKLALLCSSVKNGMTDPVSESKKQNFVPPGL